MLDAVRRGSPPPSLAENAKGGPAALIPRWVGRVRAGICTLGQAPLAGGQEPAQTQATLMQRGPIVAGPAGGCSCSGRCPEVPAGREDRLRAPGAGWSSGTAAQPRPKLSFLTQEGSTPFMEALRALSAVHVRVGALARGGGGARERPCRLSGSSQAQHPRRPDGEAGGEELRTSRALAEPQVLGP